MIEKQSPHTTPWKCLFYTGMYFLFSDLQTHLFLFALNEFLKIYGWKYRGLYGLNIKGLRIHSIYLQSNFISLLNIFDI